MLNVLAALASMALAPADRVSESDLAAHIRILASDEYEGRKPGTVASNKTLSYIAAAWSRAGLQPGAADGSWYQPVALVDTTPNSSELRWNARGKPFAVDEIVLGGTEPRQRLAAPVTFVGYGLSIETDIRGHVLLMLGGEPLSTKSVPSRRSRIEALEKAGAAAVIIIGDPKMTWDMVQPFRIQPQTSRRLYNGAISGFITSEEMARLVSAAGRDPTVLIAAAALSGFKAVRLDVEVDGWVETTIRRYTSHNVVARLPGKGADGEAVAITGHWDHLGICRPGGAPDRICNGAVDNASGIAVMIEVAERLARGPRPARDVLFVATTAEESGLLGANAYVDAPTVPLGKIVALLNIDTIAIGPRGMPVSAVNRGNTAIDPLIDEVARQLGRTLDTDMDANAFLQRQDGAAFARAGVPAVMAGGSFADMPRLQAFLGSVYHGPDDEFSDALPLGGAAEDAELHVLLARALADPARYQRKPVAAPLP